MPASVFGLKDAGPGGKVTMDFYVRDDGTPVVISLHADWTDVSGGTDVPATMAFDIHLTNVGEGSSSSDRTRSGPGSTRRSWATRSRIRRIGT